MGKISLFLTISLISFFAITQDKDRHLMTLYAPDSFVRTMIEESGASIISIDGDLVKAIGGTEEKRIFENRGWLKFAKAIGPLDFPETDAAFHNYDEMTGKIATLAFRYPSLIKMTSIGETHERRDVWVVRISDFQVLDEKPSIVFVGGHHAREHLSVELPLMLIEYLLEKYIEGDERVQRLLKTRDIHIVPMINPDGAEYDISSRRYRYWRKNRRPNDNGTYGVDLNRNYGFKWGTGGSSRRPGSDTYMGKQPFSEPESRAFRDYVKSLNGATTLLSFHTFSELILYPWGHKSQSIGNQRDLRVHQKMAQEMSRWNGYRPMQSSELYVASGDTTDWSYGELGLISFTFELDPSSQGEGGFYPGADKIKPVFEKNLPACLYLIENADNPYKVLDE